MTDIAREHKAAEERPVLSAKLAGESSESLQPGVSMNSYEAQGDQARGLLAQSKIEIRNNDSTSIKELTKPLTLEQLSKTPSDQLARLYENSPAGKIPSGDMNGQAIFMPGSRFGAVLSDIADSIWKGKVFEPHGALVNKILGHDIIKADVSIGPSWLDGKPSTIIDYGKTSLVAGFIRDEIREVNPGLYLGVAYARLPFNHHVPALYFALDANKKS